MDREHIISYLTEELDGRVPISPCLFVLCMEKIHILFPFYGECKVEDDASQKKWIVGVKCDVCG